MSNWISSTFPQIYRSPPSPAENRIGASGLSLENAAGALFFQDLQLRNRFRQLVVPVRDERIRRRHQKNKSLWQVASCG